MINLVREKNPMPEQSPEVRVGNFEEVSQGYTKDMAIREAMRCLKCRKKPCMMKGCPTQMRIPEFIAKVAEGDFEAASRSSALSAHWHLSAAVSALTRISAKAAVYMASKDSLWQSEASSVSYVTGMPHIAKTRLQRQNPTGIRQP